MRPRICIRGSVLPFVSPPVRPSIHLSVQNALFVKAHFFTSGIEREGRGQGGDEEERAAEVVTKGECHI